MLKEEQNLNSFNVCYCIARNTSDATVYFNKDSPRGMFSKIDMYVEILRIKYWVVVLLSNKKSISFTTMQMIKQFINNHPATKILVIAYNLNGIWII